jgi:hypothetical protein
MPRKKRTPLPPAPTGEDTQTTPITGCMRELRGEDPSDQQNKIFAEFITREATPKERELFEKGFKNSVALDALETSLQGPISKSARPVYKKCVGRLRNQITPASKLAAAERHGELKEAVSALLKQYGYPTNIGAFMRRLNGRRHGLGDRALRDYLREHFGIAGKRGRKPR